MKNKSLTKNKGFTLIELLLTVTIIGVLASIAVPFYKEQKQKAYLVLAKSAIVNARTAFESRFAKDPDGSHIFNILIDSNGIASGSLTNINEALPGYTHTNGVCLSLNSSGDQYTIKAAHSKGPEGYTGSTKKAFEFSSSGSKISVSGSENAILSNTDLQCL